MMYEGKNRNEYRNRRAQTVSLRKWGLDLRHNKLILIVVGVAVVVAIIFSCVSVRALASSKPQLYKYYTSVKVRPGDTLWDMAGDYVSGSTMSRSQFVDEVSRINGLSDGNIKSGEYIVVVYYSTEQK